MNCGCYFSRPILEINKNIARYHTQTDTHICKWTHIFPLELLVHSDFPAFPLPILATSLSS